jgi:hypothetical protein
MFWISFFVDNEMKIILQILVWGSVEDLGVTGEEL